MRVSEKMTPVAASVGADAALKDAAQVMSANDMCTVPVMARGIVVGLITDRDIVMRSTAMGHDPNKVRVEDIMTPGAVMCSVDEDVADAKALMAAKKVRRLVVVNGDGRPVGVLLLEDATGGG